MLNWAKGWLRGVVFLAIFGVIAVLSTGFLSWASVQNVLHFRKLGNTLKPLPGSLTMTYSGRQALVAAIDKTTGSRKDVTVYTGSPRWKDGHRTAEQVKKKVNRQFLFRGAALVLIVLPMFVFFGYVLVTSRNWIAAVPMGLIAAEQFVPFVLGPDPDDVFSF